MPERKNLIWIKGEVLKFGDSYSKIVFFIFCPFTDIDRLDDCDSFRPCLCPIQFIGRILCELKPSSGDKIGDPNPENSQIKP
jgi:hypothetical protein